MLTAMELIVHDRMSSITRISTRSLTVNERSTSRSLRKEPTKIDSQLFKLILTLLLRRAFHLVCKTGAVPSIDLLFHLDLSVRVRKIFDEKRKSSCFVAKSPS